MLLQLRLQPAPPLQPGDAFQLLLDCHERIQTFSGLAVRLARLSDVPARERAAVAQRIAHYFTVGMPRHVEDEDLSLAPRLREAGASPEALQALEKMSCQHQEIDTVLTPLQAAWRELYAAPERYEALTEQLEGAEQLAALLREHLELEERVLFPEARARLTQESVASIAAEIGARRFQRS